MRDDDATAAERREAEALARALEGQPDGAGEGADALEAAAMLRHGDGELSAERGEAILQGLLGELDARPAREAGTAGGWGGWLRWLLPLGAAAAAGVVALFVLGGPPSATELPRPGLALLEAQGAALRGGGARDLARDLDREMAAYRTQVYGALEGRYGEGP